MLINGDNLAKALVLLGTLSPVPSLKQGSTEASAIKEHVLKHALPLVGHRKTTNEAKRYTKRPLVVVYYSVDFSFDYRAGEGAYQEICLRWGGGLTKVEISPPACAD